MQSQMIRETVIVDKNSHIHLDIKIPKEFSECVEVIVVPKPSETEFEEMGLQQYFDTDDDKNIDYEDMLQMESNFVKKELADPSEDVWNEYL